MRFATEALVIFVGVLLIWVILSGRGDRLATAWRLLVGAQDAGSTSDGTQPIAAKQSGGGVNPFDITALPPSTLSTMYDQALNNSFQVAGAIASAPSVSTTIDQVNAHLGL